MVSVDHGYASIAGDERSLDAEWLVGAKAASRVRTRTPPCSGKLHRHATTDEEALTGYPAGFFRREKDGDRANIIWHG